MSDARDLSRLTRIVARESRVAALWPPLHAHALSCTGAKSSVLLRFSPRNGQLLPTTAAGIDELDHGAWLESDEGRGVIERAWKENGAFVVDDVVELQTKLGARAAMLVPIASREGRLGLLALGVNERAQAEAGIHHARAVADLIALTIERAHLEREADLQQDLRQLVSDFSRALSSSLHLTASLEVFADRARRLFASDRVSIWLHDRRARLIELVASSDVAEVTPDKTIPADDKRNQIALVMRATRAALATADAPQVAPNVLVPLRGRQRALGTLVIEGVRIEPGDEFDVLQRFEELGRQLSSAIENLWLLEDVLRSRRELENTVNSLADLVVVSDRHARITHANQAFTTKAGKRPDEILGHSLAEFVAPQVMQWLGQLTAEEMSATNFHSREMADKMLGGTFMFTVSPLVGRDDERIGLVVVARDVTDVSRHVAERAELRDRLTQSEKLAALGQFVAGIAHELNNPLQGVLGHLELMLHDSSALTPRAKRDLKVVFREADRAAKIVHNLLVFAGSRRITRRRLNVSRVVSRALSLRASACASAGIDVVKELAPDLPRVSGDSLLLQQALLNIIVNGEQALAMSDRPRRLEIRTFRCGNAVHVEIADNGPGIPPEVLPRLFEPFFTTKEVGKGTGLGLAIAYGIVQEHGGELHAGNRPEGGAIFRLELPAGSDAVE